MYNNFDKRMVHVSKFSVWLRNNDDTPINTKLTILNSCVYNTLLYGVEYMGDTQAAQDIVGISQKCSLALTKNIDRTFSVTSMKRLFLTS